MFICSICRFDVELDDVAVGGTPALCICLRCFTRETGSAKPMPKSLRRQLSTALAAI
jgi:hypothetical protein